MANIQVNNFDDVNLVLNQLSRRTFKNVVGLLSPVILAFSKMEIAEDGIIGQIIIPCIGTLTSISVLVPGVTKDKVPLLNVELS